MGKIVAIVNQKGGVGKTTSAVNLTAALGDQHKKVLLVDIDPQGNATSGMGIKKKGISSTYDLLIGEAAVDDVLVHTKYKHVDVLPSSIELAGAEVEIVEMENRVQLLKNQLLGIKQNYDYILIDCPPSLGLITLNALTAADTFLVPIQCEYYALEGLSQLMHTIDLVQERLNASLEIEGVVFTMYDARRNLSLQVVENVKNSLNQNIYKTIIPRNVRLAEAPSYGLPINYYDSKSTGAESYRLLAEEVVHKGDETWQ